LPPALFCVTMGLMMTWMATRIVLITGERQVGKSTALRGAVARLQRAYVRISGLLTERTGPHDLEVTELHTDARYPLTDPFHDVPGSPTRQFAMNEAALARAGRALEASFPTQVLVLDELGPLELIHRQGWVGALELLCHEAYDLALVVVRPELLGAAVMALPGMTFAVLRVTPDNRGALPERLAEAITAHLTQHSAYPSGILL
jgi:nucleoside-triphosphatase THEP1